MAFSIPNKASAAISDEQAEPDSVDIDILVAGVGGVGVVSGCGVTPQGSPNMTVTVAAGTVQVAGSNVAVTSGLVTITANSSGNPRFDLVCVNSSGTKSAVAGATNANPTFPSIPSNSVVLAAVYVPSGVSAITAGHIVDKRVVPVAFGTSTGTVAAGDDARITTISFEVGGRVGTLTAETAGTTKTPRLYNRTGRTWTVTAVYVSVDTAPTGSGITTVTRKNGSATGAITASISAAANTGSTTGQSLSVADGDYLQAWPTAVGSTVAGTDLSVLIVGTTA